MVHHSHVNQIDNLHRSYSLARHEALQSLYLFSHLDFCSSYQAGGFDSLLLDSLYEDEAARRQLQLQNAGYNAGYGYQMTAQSPLDQHDPFAMSNAIAPPTNVQMALMSQQEQMMMQQQQMQQQNMMMVPHQYPAQYSQQQQVPYMASANPFGDPFGYPQNATPQQGNHTLI